LARDISKKRDVNSGSFADLTLILLLHYLVKFRSGRLAVYSIKFILGSACISSVTYAVLRWGLPQTTNG